MAKIDPKATVTNETFHEGIDYVVEKLDEIMDEKDERLKEELRQEMRSGFDRIERRLDKTPSRMEFEKFKLEIETRLIAAN